MDLSNSLLGFRKDEQRLHASGVEASPYVDVSGTTTMRKAATGACRKCGYPGHLSFQCYNFLNPKQGAACLDISSTSSESDFETPLAKDDKQKKQQHKKKKKHMKKREHKHHKRKRKRNHSGGRSSTEDETSGKKEKRPTKS